MPLQKVYVQCNPLLDISAHVDEAFLAKWHVQKASASLVTEEQMGIYAELEKQPGGCTFVPGGSGLNTARVAQWVASGASAATADASAEKSFVSYVGCVADDRYGKLLTEAAEKDGVSMVLERTAAAPTGSCAVCILDKERSLVANLAAANCLSAAHMRSAPVAAALAAASLYYLTGFTLTIDVEHVKLVAAAARAKPEGRFMLNLSAPFIIQFFTEALMAVMPSVDVLFANEDEARTLARTLKWDEPVATPDGRTLPPIDAEDVAAIARRAAEVLPYSGPHRRLVVFTQGSQPTVVATAPAAPGEAAATSETVPVPPIAAEKIVDTNGAGDAFVGGFLAALALGRPVVRCCECGHYAAGVVIQHDGCTYPAAPEIAP